ncbi:class II aldolase/adducin family protein [Kiritimatiella glycovorans]|uniref:L-ribulose-5-phosphate 4-epimerase n=1 Tax=Kiritimatiella glycovorans TaxID=1307763 RepID=A0A0G3EN45_9BACT|nr:class II aldolase/adducin family protein [Kiritimatiella glycovorans]AKJ65574.1 L-ribulose-5-phosphate 4-epimerase [Kiritimatiella glycovorans]
MDEAGQAKAEVARFTKRLYEEGLITVSGGNVSMRIDADRIAITPSAVDKGALDAAQIGELGMDGDMRGGGLKSSIETGMHLAIYRRAPETGAIVHAHPPYASVFTAIDRELDTTLIAESYAILGRPAFAPYAIMGSPELAEQVAACAEQAACILMEQHGALALGRDLTEAFNRVEVLEHTARINLYAALLGGARKLDDERLAALDALMGRIPLKDRE